MSQTALKARVDAELDAFTGRQAALLESVDPLLAPIAEQSRAVVAAGKRMRAAFCYWGWRSAGQPDSPAAVRAAAAMELVHAAALVHDDLIDDSPVRRGAPTQHIALRRLTGRSPDPAMAARSLALLVGDLLMAWSGQLFTDCGLPAMYLARARPMWATLARELVAGECLEILRTGAEPCPEASLTVVRYKTAKYTVEHPLVIGGLLGGASQRMLQTFSAYGVPLGEAYQLRDDLLAVFGDPGRTGKSNLDDVAAARPTALVALALRDGDAEDRRTLRGLLGRADLVDADLAAVRAVMERTGARARVESMISERVHRARAALAGSALPSNGADALREMTSIATVRSH